MTDMTRGLIASDARMILGSVLAHHIPFAIERYAASKSGLLARTFRIQYRTIYKLSSGRKLLDRIYRERELDRFKRKILTVPNALTISRLTIAPLFPWLLASQRPAHAFGLLLYCGITDLLDGWIARKFNQKSALGSILDPVADKVTVLIFASSLMLNDCIPNYVAGIFVAKDLFLLASGFFLRFRILRRDKVPLTQFFNPAASSVEIKPLLISKINTALQFATLGLSIFSGTFDVYYLGLLHKSVALSTLVTGACHIFQYRNVIKRIKR